MTTETAYLTALNARRALTAAFAELRAADRAARKLLSCDDRRDANARAATAAAAYRDAQAASAAARRAYQGL